MRSRYNDREPPGGPTRTRESLVDLADEPSKPEEVPPGFKPRRKRLSDCGTEGTVEPQPAAPTPPRRPSLATGKPRTSPPASQPPSAPAFESPRPRAASIAPAGEEQEISPRPGRPRGAISYPCDNVPGLQTLLRPPTVEEAPPPVPEDRTTPPRLRTGPAEPQPRGIERQIRPNSGLALAGGFTAAAVGAVVWALVAVTLDCPTGWMAVGVGLLVGGVVRMLGRGTDRSFGHLGAALSIFGCLLGNLLGLCAIIAGQEGSSLPTVLARLCVHPVLIPAAMLVTVHSLDLLFYGLALYAGYRLPLIREIPLKMSSSAKYP